MLMLYEYRADLLDHVREEPEETFTAHGIDREALIDDRDTVDRMWALYQKDVEEYGVEPYAAFRGALREVLSVPLPDDGPGTGDDA